MGSCFDLKKGAEMVNDYFTDLGNEVVAVTKNGLAVLTGKKTVAEAKIDTQVESNQRTIEQNKQSFNDTYGNMAQFLTNAGGGIAGALGGWKLGEKFGPVGKFVGSVGFALVGANLGKVVKEVGTDVAAAQDYVREAEKKGQEASFWKTLGSNVLNVKGQTYTGTDGAKLAKEADGPDV